MNEEELLRRYHADSQFSFGGLDKIKDSVKIHQDQGPTSTRYSNQTRIFLYYSNPTRKFLKNDRVASSMYSSHFRKNAALPCCSKDKVTLSEHQMPKAEQGMKISLSKT